MTSQAFFEKSTRSSSLACHLTGKTVYLGDESICAQLEKALELLTGLFSIKDKASRGSPCRKIR